MLSLDNKVIKTKYNMNKSNSDIMTITNKEFKKRLYACFYISFFMDEFSNKCILASNKKIKKILANMRVKSNYE